KGFRNYRVRYHGDVARIEVAPEEIDRMLDAALREEVVAEFKNAGFAYVALDLQGYRTGSMNEVTP
ncbi:MAG: TIGR00268 family protein, partial [Desulfuromonadales bacterium]|nr:TIGR00268 family protein [Desulfuromonadales bacterium]